MAVDERKKKGDVSGRGICMYLLKGGRIHYDGAMNYHRTERGGGRDTTLKQKIENTGSTKENCQ